MGEKHQRGSYLCRPPGMWRQEVSPDCGEGRMLPLQMLKTLRPSEIVPQLSKGFPGGEGLASAKARKKGIQWVALRVPRDTLCPDGKAHTALGIKTPGCKKAGLVPPARRCC